MRGSKSVKSQELTGSRPNATSVCRCHGPNGPCDTEQTHERTDPTIGRWSLKGSPSISARGFSARHGIGPGIEMLRIQDLHEACERIEQGEVRFRYVIDMAFLAEEPVPAQSG